MNEEKIVRLVHHAQEPAPPDDSSHEAKCPVVPLGHRQGTYFFLSPSGEFRALGFRELTVNGLASLFDGDVTWLNAKWPLYEGKGEARRQTGFDAAAAARGLIAMSGKAGIFDQATIIRGPGVWRTVDSELLVHCGDVLLAPARSPCSVAAGQMLDGVIYAAGARIGRPDLSEPATISDCGVVLSRLRAWPFEVEMGPDIVLGWIGLAALAGAPDWRVHVMLKGPRGSGKSALTDYVAALLGAGAHAQFNDFSEAGLRQALTGEARALVLDESESEERGASRVAAVVGMIRRMSSGDGARAIRGTAAHAAQGFSVTGCAWLSAILQPPLKPQDRSRIAEIYLRPLPFGPETAVRSDLIRAWTAEARQLSSRLRGRAIINWSRFQETLAVYRQAAMGAGLDVRETDKLAALLAGRDLLLFDVVPDSDSAEAELQRFTSLVTGAIDDAEDGEGFECLSHLYTSPADHVWRSGERGTVAQVVLAAMGKAAPGFPLSPSAARRLLGCVGLIYEPGAGGDEARAALYIANQHVGLSRLFADTRWCDGKWRDALHFLPGADAGGRRRFAGSPPTRSTVLPVIYLPKPEDEIDLATLDDPEP